MLITSETVESEGVARPDFRDDLFSLAPTRRSRDQLPDRRIPIGFLPTQFNQQFHTAVDLYKSSPLHTLPGSFRTGRLRREPQSDPNGDQIRRIQSACRDSLNAFMVESRRRHLFVIGSGPSREEEKRPSSGGAARSNSHREDGGLCPSAPDFPEYKNCLISRIRISQPFFPVNTG